MTRPLTRVLGSLTQIQLPSQLLTHWAISKLPCLSLSSYFLWWYLIMSSFIYSIVDWHKNYLVIFPIMNKVLYKHTLHHFREELLHYSNSRLKHKTKHKINLQRTWNILILARCVCQIWFPLCKCYFCFIIFECAHVLLRVNSRDLCKLIINQVWDLVLCCSDLHFLLTHRIRFLFKCSMSAWNQRKRWSSFPNS